MSLRKVLVANRGEIAVRVIRACRDLGIPSVAVHSEADRGAFVTRLADEAVEIGPGPAPRSYLDPDRIVEAARRTGADAVHPGYGFLSESASFAERCQGEGLTLIAPPAAAIRTMGDKILARQTMAARDVPVLPGSGALDDDAAAAAEAERLGYPLLLKASAGGGGLGMRMVGDEAELRSGLEAVRGLSRRAFGDATVFLERWLDRPRHIEIQVLADGAGTVIHLGERECSIQRRRQKLLEESPSPAVGPELRRRMGETAVRAARAVGYSGAGTVEFVVSGDEFFFIEMNTRLQVEHPVTELVTGIDIVAAQLRVAADEPLGLVQEEILPRGHAVECRVYAESHSRGFAPAPGRVTGYREPGGPGVRVDSGLDGPGPIPAEYDPMIAKVITWGGSRDEACDRMRRALLEYAVVGVETTIPFHLAVLAEPDFRAGDCSTSYIDEHPQLMEEADRWERVRAPLLRGVGRRAHVAAIAAALAATAPAGA